MPRRLPEVLTEEEARALLSQQPRTSTTGLRNYTALALMWRAGLRVSEVCALTPKDIDLDECVVRVWRGKGAKDRTVPLDPETSELLRLWALRRPKRSPFLLPVIQAGTKGAGRARPGGPISPRFLQILLKRLAKRAQISRRVSPHTLRHTYATDALREGAPVSYVQRLLGHSDLSTTATYLHVFPAELQQWARSRRRIGLVEDTGDGRGNGPSTTEAPRLDA